MQGHMGDIRQCSAAEMLGIQRRRHAGKVVGEHFSRWFRLGTTCNRDNRFSKMREMDKKQKMKEKFYMVLVLVSDFSFLCTRKATFPVPLLLGKVGELSGQYIVNKSLMCYFWAEAVKNPCVIFPVSLFPCHGNQGGLLWNHRSWLPGFMSHHINNCPKGNLDPQ